MVCNPPSPNYFPKESRGILTAYGKKTGDGIAITWNRAYPPNTNYNLTYNLYYSTDEKNLFNEGPKFVSTGSILAAEIYDLVPGDTYWFAVRASLHEKNTYNLNFLPASGELKVYPEGNLIANLSATALSIVVGDVEQFPPTGVVQVGSELIRYTGRDLSAGKLILSSIVDRGYYGTDVRSHSTDGYDGYFVGDPFVKFWRGFEDNNIHVAVETNKFSYRLPYTSADGYRIQADHVTTDLSGSDALYAGTLDGANPDGTGTDTGPGGGFASYDHSGWRRIDPAALLRGDCVGSYFGGEKGCVDGLRVRGGDVNKELIAREEVTLELTGKPVVLVKRMYTGVTCRCYDSANEQALTRCSRCYGTGLVSGFYQFFNPRRSDGKILVRFGPSEDDIKQDEEGLEMIFNLEGTTLAFPAIHDRDFIIRFNPDGTEEYRYKVLGVTRNDLFFGQSGGQKLKLQRVRKTDIIYQVPTYNDSSTMPSNLSTSIGFIRINSTPTPHSHVIRISENITNVSQINQLTSVAAGHVHIVKNGIITEFDESGSPLFHKHLIVI